MKTIKQYMNGVAEIGCVMCDACKQGGFGE